MIADRADRRAWAPRIRGCSPPGAGLYFSYLARPTRYIELLTIAAGVGVREGVSRATGVHAHLKWPNDLLVGHRKLGWRAGRGRAPRHARAAVIVGVGVNLRPAAYPPDVAARATDLESELRAPAPRFVLVNVLEHLADGLRALDAGRRVIFCRLGARPHRQP